MSVSQSETTRKLPYPEERLSRRLEATFNSEGMPRFRGGAGSSSGSTYGNHNLKWEDFTAETAGNGGHEIYNFLAEVAVASDGVPAEVAATMRCLNKTFRDTVDPLIRGYMVKLNETIAALQSSIRSGFDHDNGRPVRPLAGAPEHELQAYDGWTQRREQITHSVSTMTETIQAKFGYHTAMTLKKCMSEHATVGRGHGRSTYGWPPTGTDVPRLGTTVHCYLAMAGKHTCELHGRERKHCACTATIGGAFTYVPNCKGLIMHCSDSCIASHCIIINPSSGVPLVQRSRKDPQDVRMLELCKSLLMQVGVPTPFSRDSIRNRVGHDAWAVSVHNVHNLLLQRRPQLDSSSALRFLVLGHPTVVNDARASSFQGLIGASDANVNDAHKHIAEADALEARIYDSHRTILKEHGKMQIDRLLNQHGAAEGLSDLTLNDAENLLPGVLNLVNRAVLDTVAATPVERVRETNVLAQPFTMRIVSAVVLGLGPMRRYDMSFSSSLASSFAYSYITGLCAGADAGFDIRELSAQINLDLAEPNVSIMHWRDAITTLHVFDALDYTTIRVTQCPTESISTYIRDYHGGAIPNDCLVLKWSFDVGGRRISGPLVATSARAWYEEKVTGGYSLLENLGFRSKFRRVPDDIHFQCFNGASDDRLGDNATSIRKFCDWFTHTAQHLCARPESRSMGLDLLTGDRTRMLIQLVSEADLDTECVAVSAASLQQEEQREDAADLATEREMSVA